MIDIEWGNIQWRYAIKNEFKTDTKDYPNPIVKIGKLYFREGYKVCLQNRAGNIKWDDQLDQISCPKCYKTGLTRIANLDWLTVCLECENEFDLTVAA